MHLQPIKILDSIENFADSVIHNSFIMPPSVLWLAKDGGKRFTVQMPGYTKDDIVVELRDRVLHVMAEVKEKDFSSTASKKMTRLISLPKNMDAESLTCSYRSGELYISGKDMIVDIGSRIIPID